ncbi:MAG: HemK/PrmC family methyltransferase, partial [Bacilli bacterium]
MKAHKSIREAHLWASSLLEEQGIAEGKMVSEWMLRHLLMWERSTFFTRFNDDFDPSLDERFQEMVKRRLSGEPLQYILGEQSFYGLTFKVDHRVLIPRPETEALVENIVTLADTQWGKDSVLHIADIGTGSGAIAITLAKIRPNWSVTTVDISADALEVARGNATLNGVADRVTFVNG